MTKKIITVVGARPQFVKAAALSRVLKDHSGFSEKIIHTGQHHDAQMSDIFFEELNIPKPAYQLDIHGGQHGQMTGRMLEGIEEILLQEKPDAVLVYGDTNSTLAGALAAAKLHIPVIHVEAGLRSFNKKMPEEINRILTDNVSELLFCPSRTAMTNLKNEGNDKAAFHVGDVMYDATLFAIDKIKGDQALAEKFKHLPQHYALMTIHRAESTDSADTFKEMIDFAEKFAQENNLTLLFPVHPRTQKLIKESLEGLPSCITTIDPISYFETQFLLSKASYVLTDSGGLQKEAYFHQVPCVTLRSETEWTETIEAGWNRLWKGHGTDAKTSISDYGTGNAAEIIVENIQKYLT